jgi:hypothetical protein
VGLLETSVDNLETSITSNSKAGTLRRLSALMQDTAWDIASTGLYGIVYNNINMNFWVAEQVVGSHSMHNVTLY